MRHPATRRKSHTPRPSLGRRPARVPASDFRPSTSDFVLSRPSRLLLSNTYFERPPAFTLIELLVVISIIAVLAGLAFPVLSGVADQAKKVQAKNDLTQIVVAVNAFYTEYGKYPQPSANAPTQDVSYGDGNNSGTNKSFQLIDCLMAPLKNAGDTNAVVQNPRQVSFLQPKMATDSSTPKGGIDTTGNYFDPWGRTYAIAVDNSYDNVTQTYIAQYADIANTYTAEPQSGTPGIGATCIGYSFGKDGEQGKKGDKNYRGSDDVLSWQ